MSDGDGGTANRVVAMEVDANGTHSLLWATPQVYNQPHSLAIHRDTQYLVVADRANNATKLLDSATGEDLGVWDCGLHFGEQGVPFGVTVYDNDNLIYVSSMDNPQDHKNQRITVLDGQFLSRKAGAKSKCVVLDTILIDPAAYSGQFTAPHCISWSPSCFCIHVYIYIIYSIEWSM